MVEYMAPLDLVFGSLSDATRRDILKRVARKQLTVGEISQHYDLTFAAISKHLKILERAKLIIKQKQGRCQLVQLAPQALREATNHLQRYEALWNERFDRLEKLVREKSHGKR